MTQLIVKEDVRPYGLKNGTLVQAVEQNEFGRAHAEGL